MSKRKKGRRLLGLFFLFMALLNYPIIMIWFGEGMIWGMPRIFVNIFVLWLLLILILASILERDPSPNSPK
ncbi:MAG: hypothetical protein AAF985_25115 [Bacteroidota bacterium]